MIPLFLPDKIISLKLDCESRAQKIFNLILLEILPEFDIVLYMLSQAALYYCRSIHAPYMQNLFRCISVKVACFSSF